jgi:hypothetical protein
MLEKDMQLVSEWIPYLGDLEVSLAWQRIKTELVVVAKTATNKPSTPCQECSHWSKDYQICAKCRHCWPSQFDTAHVG